jgi:hypothetical protein
VLVAIVAYGLGAQSGTPVAAGEPVRRVYWGGFPGFWVFFLLFWFLFGGLRRMWWGWAYPYYRPWGYRRYPPYADERDEWEEWHRRAHERIDAAAPRPTTASSTDRPPIA